MDYPEHEAVSLRAELERMRADATKLWLPFRWYFNRKLDRLEAILDQARDLAIQRYFQS